MQHDNHTTAKDSVSGIEELLPTLAARTLATCRHAYSALHKAVHQLGSHVTKSKQATEPNRLSLIHRRNQVAHQSKLMQPANHSHSNDYVNDESSKSLVAAKQRRTTQLKPEMEWLIQHSKPVATNHKYQSKARKENGQQQAERLSEHLDDQALVKPYEYHAKSLGETVFAPSAGIEPATKRLEGSLSPPVLPCNDKHIDPLRQFCATPVQHDEGFRLYRSHIQKVGASHADHKFQRLR